MNTLTIGKHYLPLCWFKRDPTQLPRSTAFLRQNLIFSFIVEYFMQLNMIDDPVESFFEVSIQIGLSLLFIGFILLINKTLYAYVQISTALFFCGNVVSIFVVPTTVWLTVTYHPISIGLTLFLATWIYALFAYIFKKVLMINVVASIILTTTYFLATYLAAFGIAQLI